MTGDPILLKVFSDLAVLVGKEAAKKILNGLFSSTPDQFKSIVEESAEKLDSQYRGELFGGNLKQMLTRPETIELLKRFLIPFDEPSESEFAEHFDLGGLPKDFVNALKSTLLNDLMSSPFYSDRVVEVFQSNRIEQVHSATQDLQQKVDDILVVLKKMSVEAKKDVFQKFPEKKSYDRKEEYIPRLVFPLQEARNPFPKAQFSLIDILQSKNKVLLLSSAGLGKTVELENLASFYSDAGQIGYPIKVALNLYTGSEVEDLLQSEFAGWTTVPPELLVIIFDGLDEIHTSLFEAAIKKLINFSASEKYRKTKIVVSCRDNFFNSDFVRRSPADGGFEAFKLKELDHWSIVKFINQKLGEALGEKFLQDVHEQSLYNLLTSPFFLNYLIAIYHRERKLPASKLDVFEKLIDHRINKDKERFATKGIKIEKKEAFIRDQIQRLALIMESSGKNFLTDVEFERIIPTYEGERELIEHTFLFNSSGLGTWQFEHNNFKEYLAAAKLSGHQFANIRRLVTLPPEHEIIMPGWVNTLSFLFIGLRKNNQIFDSLLKWIKEADKELLLRFEKDRVDLATREEIFQTILEDYQSKGIVTRSEKFDIRDLAKFVSDSRATIDLLITKLNGAKSNLVIGEVCGMLHLFEFISERRNELKTILEKLLQNHDTHTEAKCYTLYALSELKWQSKISFDRIFPQLDLESQYERAGLYKYLASSGFADDYVDLILKITGYDKGPRVYVNERPSRRNFDLGDENIFRDECFDSISSVHGVTKIIQFLGAVHESHEDDFLVRGTLEKFIKKAAHLFNSGEEGLFTTVLESLSLFSKYYRRDFDTLFREFFRETNTIHRACLELISSANESKERYYFMAVIADDSFIDFLLNEFEKGRLVDDNVYSIRQSLAISRPNSTHDRFYFGINKISGDRYLYEPVVSWTELNIKRYRKDLDLVMNREEFLKSIEKIFQLEGKETLDKDDLWDFSKKYVKDEDYLDNNIALDLLRREEIKPIPLERIQRRYRRDEDWKWFQISSLLHYDTNNLVELELREINFIKSWADEALKGANFRTAITNETYRLTEIYLGYAIKRFDFSYSEKVYLDLISIDSQYVPQKRETGDKKTEHERIGDWVVRKVGVQKVKERMVENFRSKILSSTVLRNHIALCKKYEFKEALPAIEDELGRTTLKDMDVLGCVMDYLELGGATQVAEEMLESDNRLSENDQLNLIEALIKHASKGVVNYLERKLIEGQENLKITYSKYLMKLGRINGLLFYKEWIARNKTFHDWIDQRHFLAIPHGEALPVLLEILEIYFQPDFDRDHLHAQDQDLLQAINQIGCLEDADYRTVRNAFRDFIARYEAKQLHYYLRNLDQLYYENRTKSASIVDVIKMVDSL